MLPTAITNTNKMSTFYLPYLTQISDAAAMPHKAAHAKISRGLNFKTGISGLGAASAGESDSTLQYRGRKAKATPPLLCAAGEPSSSAATSLG
jgi:hypothetical protein